MGSFALGFEGHPGCAGVVIGTTGHVEGHLPRKRTHPRRRSRADKEKNPSWNPLDSAPLEV